MKFAVIVFPGSNCDHDMEYAIKNIMGQDAEFVSSQETSLKGFDGILMPGGFSYGDYLRGGALSARSQIADAIKNAANEGKPVIGVCNGFQILTEMKLLPGALIRNKDTKFVCKMTTLRVENNKTMFTGEYKLHEEVNIPVAHGEGNYYADEETLKKLRKENRILFTYKNNFNGSLNDIAGITNERGNVLGMMPHPERAMEKILGSDDGIRFFKSVIGNWKAGNL